MLWENIEEDRHYSGAFSICDEEIKGEIIYNKSRGIILLDLEKELYEENLPNNAIDQIDIIPGVLNTGSCVILLDNRCILNHTDNMRYQELQYISKKLLWGSKHKDELQYNKLDFVVSNALHWSGLTPFEKTEDFSLKVKEFGEWDCKVYNWFGTKVTFGPFLNNSFLSAKEEDIEINQRLSITIESDEKKDVDFFITVRNKILSLISFGICDNVNLEKQTLRDNDDYYTYSNGVKDYYRYELFSSEPYLIIMHTRWWHYNFKLPELENTDGISETLSKLSPVFNLYLSLFKYDYMPREMIFLNIIQAVETFHARFFFDDVKQFIKYVDENHVPYMDLIVSKWQRKANHIFLQSRLFDLLTRTEIPEFQRYYLDHNLDFVRHVTDTRHYYTHYGKNKEEKALHGKDMDDAIFVLRTLLEFHICKLLGIDNCKQIDDKLKQRYRRIHESGSVSP